MTFNTGNNVPSTDPRDLYDNAENFDKLLNGADPFYADRKGVLRQSYAGMENDFDTAQEGRETAFTLSQADKESRFQSFLLSSGYVSKGNYAANVVLAERNEYVFVSAATTGTTSGLYFPAGAAVVPLTLTGDWATDLPKLALREEDVLRQELASPAGSERVGHGAGTVSDALDSLDGRVDDIVYSLRTSLNDFSGLVDRSGPAPWDWTAAIQALVDGGGSCFIPAGEYLSSQISLPSTSLDLEIDDDAVIRFSGSGFIGGGAGAVEVFSLTSDAVAGSRDISAATTGIVAGDWVMVRSTGSRTDNQPRNGEIARVVAVTPTALTLDRKLVEGYGTSVSASVAKMQMASRIRIKGGRLVGSGASDALASGVEVKNAANVEICNMEVVGFHNRGVSVNNCVDYSIHNNSIRDCLNPTTGYAILSTAASQWGNVYANKVENCGKVWDNGGLSSEFGLTRWVVISDNHGRNLKRGGVSTHETGEFIKILNNHLFDLPGSIGLFTRTVNTEIAGNTIHNPGLGGIVCTNRGATGGLAIRDNTVEGAPDSECSIQVYVQDNSPGTKIGFFNDLSIHGNQTRGGIDGIQIDVRIANLRGVVVANNICRDFVRDGIRLWANGSSVFGACVGSNYLWGRAGAAAGVHLRADTGSVNEVMVSGNGTVNVATGVLADGVGTSTVRSAVTGNVLRATSAGVTGITSQSGNMVVIA